MSDIPMSGWRGEPTSAEGAQRMENRLRADYVNGAIEIEEFEERLGLIFSGDPTLADRLRAAPGPDDIRFGPGVLIPVSGVPRHLP